MRTLVFALCVSMLSPALCLESASAEDRDASVQVDDETSVKRRRRRRRRRRRARPRTPQFDERKVVGQIHRRGAVFNRCYLSASRYNHSLEGRVQMEFTISESGATTEASVVENSTGSSSLAGCLDGVLSRMQWSDSPPETTTFSYTFVFQRRAGA